MRTRTHVRFEKIKYKSQLFVVSSAVNLGLVFHWLDLLMDFYCRNQCWIRKEIFDWLDWNVTWLFGMIRKMSSSTSFFVSFFIFYISECIVTIHSWCKLRQIRVWVKRKFKKKALKWPRPRPRVLLTPINKLWLTNKSSFSTIHYTNVTSLLHRGWISMSWLAIYFITSAQNFFL